MSTNKEFKVLLKLLLVRAKRLNLGGLRDLVEHARKLAEDELTSTGHPPG